MCCRSVLLHYISVESCSTSTNNFSELKNRLFGIQLVLVGRVSFASSKVFFSQRKIRLLLQIPISKCHSTINSGDHRKLGFQQKHHSEGGAHTQTDTQRYESAGTGSTTEIERKT